jgi:hypothetical protein
MMNRRRNETRTPLSVYLSLFLAAAIAGAGGVLHAFYKNRQVQVSREIRTVDRRVAQCRLDINITDMRMDQLLNRFAIRKQIEANGSSLRPIPIGTAEEVGSDFSARQDVASATP